MIKFEEELTELKKQLLEMATSVIDMVGKSVKALKDNNMILAQEVINSDESINQREIEIDTLCIKIVALYNPEARDLRTVVMAMRINNELERIGDHAVSIAKMSLHLSEQPHIKPLVDTPRMAERAMDMLKGSLDSFVNKDAELAVEVCRKDDEVDDLEVQIVRELITYMISDPHIVDRALRYIYVARHLERIADLATNIAEDAYYIATGEVLKHHHASEMK